MKKIFLSLLLGVLSSLSVLSQDGVPRSNAAQSSNAAADQRLSQEQQRQIQALSAHLILNDKFVDRFLERVGFSAPPSLGSSWKFYPDYRKVVVAAAMAESVHPNRGADRLLAMLAYALAQRGDPVGHEPALARLRASNYYSAPAHLDFGELPVFTSPSKHLDVEHVKAIKALSSFLESGSLGTPQSIMVHYLGLSFDQSFALLERSSSTSDALGSALARLDTEHRSVAITAITRDAARINPALKYEDALTAFLAPGRRGGPDEGPGPGFAPNPGGGSGGGGGGGTSRSPSETEVRASFAELYEKSYPNERSRRFDSMQENEKGLGGIILGNAVTKSNGASRIQRLEYVQADSSLGSLTVVFEDRTKAILDRVSFDEAVAAYRFIYSPIPGSPVWTQRQGVGLTGLTNECRAGYAPVSLPNNSREEHMRVILNPVLRNTRLGWSAIAADERATFAGAVANGVTRQMDVGVNTETRDEVYRLIFRTFQPLRHASWKITDVPLQMSVDGNSHIGFVRSDGVDDFP